jgi:protocatechuate 3,4-dioxygenase beta subunit
MNDKPNQLTRRKFLLHLSALSPVVAFVALKGNIFNGLALAQSPTPAPTMAATALDCVASPSMTEGPYFVDEMLKRGDIRTDPTDNSVKPGLPLKLQINVFSVNGSACSPLKGAQVDIWHCDAVGLYSDEQANNTVGKKFLRGYQLTDDSGQVNFITVYPGWYQGRTVHIHAKVRTFGADGTQSYVFNSQLFFDDSLSDQVFTQALYNTHTNRDTTNKTDSIYKGTATNADAHDLGEVMLLKLTKDGDAYTTIINIGVDLSKPSTEANPGGPGGPGGGPGGPGGPGGTPPATSAAG